MKTAELLNTDMFKVIGWTIIHSLWQFLALFVLLKIALFIIGKNKPGLRYFIGVIFLGASLLCSILTFNHEQQLFLGHDIQAAAGVVNATKGLDTVTIQGNLSAQPVAAAPEYLLVDLLNGISPYLTFCWMIGLVFYGAKIAAGSFYLNRLRRLPTAEHPALMARIKVLSAKMQLDRVVKLIVNAKISEPLTFGFLKPVILLPCSYIAQVPADQLEMILAHELAHIKRRDYLVNLVQTALDAVFFFNPFFRAMSGILRSERECCCDDLAVRYSGDSATMAQALTNLKVLAKYPALSLSAAPVEHTFTERVYRLIDPAARSGLSAKNSLVTFMLVLFAALMLVNAAGINPGDGTLPSAADPLKQLYTDNQANCKEQLFNYVKADGMHELFLISTIGGKPLYAYVDGSEVTKDQLNRIHQVLNKKRTMTPAEIAAMNKEYRQEKHDKGWKLGVESDSLARAVDITKAELAAHPSASLENKLKELHRLLDANIHEQVTRSMKGYSDEVKKIPAEVKLHILLNKIILGREYTPRERMELNALAMQLQNV